MPLPKNAVCCNFLFSRYLLLLSCYIMSKPFWPHGLQHARLPCPPLSPIVCSNPCPLCQWCHPTTSSVALFSSCPQSSPASGSVPMSQLFPSGAKVLELQNQSFKWIFRADFLWDCVVWSCCPRGLVQGTLKGLLQHFNLKTSIFWCSTFIRVQLPNPCMTTGKP